MPPSIGKIATIVAPVFAQRVGCAQVMKSMPGATTEAVTGHLGPFSAFSCFRCFRAAAARSARTQLLPSDDATPIRSIVTLSAKRPSV